MHINRTVIQEKNETESPVGIRGERETAKQIIMFNSQPWRNRGRIPMSNRRPTNMRVSILNQLYRQNSNHIQKEGRKYTRKLRNIMEKSYTKCLQASQSKSQKRIETADKLNNLDIQLNLLTEEREKNIMNTAHEVKRNVKSALNDEIKNLRFIVDDFCSQSIQTIYVLNVNKKVKILS
ncbi:mitofusin [Mytilus galloprovincialis]|uniref:Mitofusin n=1 Tax=Mytilus galloprovincialis TaxID=29158 RepID=A0A8B6GI70_MYTGA|nr:mitofusin [Mytilus galloprovincialis]